MNKHEAKESKVILAGDTYDKLKPVAQIWLPGLATLYLTLGKLWELPAPDKVAATITAINVFLGLVLGASSRAYSKSENRFDGEVTLHPNKEQDTTDVNVSFSPDKLNNGEILLKVRRPSPRPRE